jgi:hypothetical protein
MRVLINTLISVHFVSVAKIDPLQWIISVQLESNVVCIPQSIPNVLSYRLFDSFKLVFTAAICTVLVPSDTLG